MSKLADRVYEQTRTTGTASAVLLGAIVGYQSFQAAIGSGQPCYYVIAHPTLSEWEIGLSNGVTLSGSDWVLARTTVITSSNSNNPVNFSAGLKDVRCSVPASVAINMLNAILKDGSVAFTGDQSLGNHALTNVSAVNKVAITAPASGATLTIADGGSLITSGGHSVTLTSTGSTNVTLPTTGTLATQAGAETLSNKTLTAPVISTIVNSGTLTLPTSTDTLVGRATTDTLTNKSIDASQLTGTVAAARLGTTSQVQFGLVGINTAPDANFLLTATNASANALMSLTSGSGSAQGGFNLGYLSQTWRLAANGAFGGLAVTDVNASALRMIIMATTGNVAVGGSTTPLGKFESRYTSGAQLVGSYDASNSISFTTGSTGITTVTPAGSAAGLSFAVGLQMGTGAGRQKLAGLFHSSTTALGNVGTGEDTIATITTPASSLTSNGQSVEWEYAFFCAGNANNKRIRAYANATLVWDSQSGFPFSSGAFKLSGVLTRTGSNAQVAHVTPHTRETLASAAGVTRTVTALTESSAITLTLTAEATSDNDVVCNLSRARWVDA